jgi:hypothetical protein
LLFLFRPMKKNTTNVEKLVNAKLVELADLSPQDQQLINSLGDDEIDAIVGAGTKVVQHANDGNNLFKVIF